MSYYKHYSFDLWLTLIRSNPGFKKERAKYFHQKFNSACKPLQDIEHVFRTVDLMANAVNEKTGKNLDADELYSMVICLINENKHALDEIDISNLVHTMDQFVVDFLPFTYCSGTRPVLEKLKSNDCGISLLSNTGFIRGETLRIVLQQLELAAFFDFQLYSDELGMSKPNTQIFELMIEKANQIRPGLKSEEIIHVGDNSLADIQAAQDAGVHSFLINSNARCISELLN